METKRGRRERVVQRPLLYLGEINSSQELPWRKSIEVLKFGSVRPRTLAYSRSPVVVVGVAGARPLAIHPFQEGQARAVDPTSGVSSVAGGAGSSRVSWVGVGAR